MHGRILLLTPRANTVITRVIQTLTILVAVSVVPVLFPPVLGAVLYLRGQSGVCDLRHSFEAFYNMRAQTANEARFRSTMYVLRREGNIDLWQTPVGQYWMPHGSGEELGDVLAEQERDIYGRGSQGVRSGDIVLDCGANVGAYTKKALEQGARTVVAIEPVPDNLECLRRNLTKEISDGRVIVYPKGVWDRDDTLTMTLRTGNSAADSFVRPGEGTRILLPLTTIDALVGELQLERVDFIKMDIEGAEQRAIMGAQTAIRRFRPRMALSLYHLADDPVRIPQIVASIDSRYAMDCDCLNYGPSIGPEVGHFAIH